METLNNVKDYHFPAAEESRVRDVEVMDSAELGL
jgi:hypothetical protein